MQTQLTQHIKYIAILAIFLLSTYIGFQIKFFNNDDWVHYKTVENFLSGNFTLHPYIGSTFYVQGILAFMFAKVFGILHLPVLTILISLINIFIFNKILKLIDLRNFAFRALAIFLLVFNPLYLYSSVGFMTENYVIFFLLLAIYFQIKYIKENKISDIILSTFFIVLGFFAKQYSIFLSFSTIAYLIVKKRFKIAAIYSVVPLIVLMFYYLAFPKTEILSGQSIIVSNLVNFPASMLLGLNIFTYLSFFTIPFGIIFAFKFQNNKILVALTFLVILLLHFNYLSVESFPSIENVFGRKGLFQDIDGNKSHWAGYYKFFNYSFYLSVALSSLVLTKILLNLKYFFVRNKFIFISFVTYFGLCLVLPNFYDRYILPLIILWIIFLFKETIDIKIHKILAAIIVSWVLLYAYFNYLFITEFVVRNIAIQHADEEILKSGYEPEDIMSNRGWNNYYDVIPNDARFLFHYDDLSDLDGMEGAALEEVLQIDFPLNRFESNEIYLYKLQE